jgi:hypothetical protein
MNAKKSRRERRAEALADPEISPDELAAARRNRARNLATIAAGMAAKFPDKDTSDLAAVYARFSDANVQRVAEQWAVDWGWAEPSGQAPPVPAQVRCSYCGSLNAPGTRCENCGAR